MAAVFNVPGVPSLPSYLPGALSLLSSDLSPASFIASAGQALLQWGIFRNGQPVVVPITGLTSGLQDFSIVNGIATNVIGNVLGLPTIFPVAASFVDVEYKQDWPISDYPVEQGGFQSYDKVRLPFS